MHRGARLAGLWACVCLIAHAASAADLYASSNYVNSAGGGVVDGSTPGIVGSKPILGDDYDSSQGFGLALGFGYGLSEVFPKEWETWDTRLRFELEGVYGRNYEIVSKNGATNRYVSQVEIWTLMPNMAVDMPLHRPIAKLFGRIPILDPLTLSVGGGAGIAHVNLDAFDNSSTAKEDIYKFAYQANVGLGYQLSDTMNLVFGYRYAFLGKFDADVKQVNNQAIGEVEHDMHAHEFNLAVRWSYLERPLEDFAPWNWGRPSWTKDGRWKPTTWKRPSWSRWSNRPRWLGGRKW